MSIVRLDMSAFEKIIAEARKSADTSRNSRKFWAFMAKRNWAVLLSLVIVLISFALTGKMLGTALPLAFLTIPVWYNCTTGWRKQCEREAITLRLEKARERELLVNMAS